MLRKIVRALGCLVGDHKTCVVSHKEAGWDGQVLVCKVVCAWCGKLIRARSFSTSDPRFKALEAAYWGQ